MQILLSCAKDMQCESDREPKNLSTPTFQKQAEKLAVSMMKYSTEEMQKILKVNAQIAALNKLRYTTFLEPGKKLAAILSYTGIAYKNLKAENMSQEELDYAQQHLWLTSFLYGLLRPLDQIKNYRLEGSVRLPELDDKRLFDYWKDILTDRFIKSIKEDDGQLLNLASEEMKSLFHWNKVKESIRIIEPQFKTMKNGKMRTIVVYTKMCRGAMARQAIRNKWKNYEDVLNFKFEDFNHQPALGTKQKPVFAIE